MPRKGGKKKKNGNAAGSQVANRSVAIPALEREMHPTTTPTTTTTPEKYRLLTFSFLVCNRGLKLIGVGRLGSRLLQGTPQKHIQAIQCHLLRSKHLRTTPVSNIFTDKSPKTKHTKKKREPPVSQIDLFAPLLRQKSWTSRCHVPSRLWLLVVKNTIHIIFGKHTLTKHYFPSVRGLLCNTFKQTNLITYHL